jgi:hypothetical protein
MVTIHVPPSTKQEALPKFHDICVDAAIAMIEIQIIKVIWMHCAKHCDVG